MSIADRLKNAYENVAYNGDNTWINSSFSYQKANLELYTREQQLRLLKYSQLRPRYVKECIPKSKLAQYDNYRYNEARELSYNANIARYFTPLRLSEEFRQDGPTEPWMLPEIDDLYVWFLNYHRIKHIWDMNIVVREYNEKTITVYRSPFGNFYANGDSDAKEKYEQLYNWLTYMVPEQNSDLEQIKSLTKSLKEQNSLVNNKETIEKVIIKPHLPEVPGPLKHDTEPERRLYSAVLQGLSPKLPIVKNANEQMTILTKNADDKKKAPPEAILLLPIGESNSIVTIVEPLQKAAEEQLPLTDEIAGLEFGQSSDIAESDSKAPQSSIPLPMSNVNKTAPKIKITEDSPTAGHFMNSYTTFMSNTNFVQAPTSMSNPAANNSFSTTTSPHSHSPTYLNNYSNYQFSSHYSNSSYHQTNNCLYSNNTYCNVSQIVANRSLHYSRNYIPNAYPTYPSSVLMLQQNRSSTVYPPLNPPAYVHQTQQQTHYYNHPISLPRAAQNMPTSNYVRSTIPGQRSAYPPPMPPHFVPPPAPPAQWVVQNQQQNIQHFVEGQGAQAAARFKIKTKKLVHPQVSVLQSKGKLRSQAGSSGASMDADESGSQKRSAKRFAGPQTATEALPRDKTFVSVQTKAVANASKIDDFEEVVSKTVGIVLEERSEDSFLPVQVSVSEVLELEALEQYSPSNDNVFQELERQAAEQYDDFPENWIGPPNCDPFGGIHCTSVHCIAIIIPNV